MPEVVIFVFPTSQRTGLTTLFSSTRSSVMSDTASTETRDRLALVRTELANERTLLAYGRTGLMVTATGATLIKFFADSTVPPVIGWGLMVGGVVIGVIGVARFVNLRRRLSG